MFDLGVNQADLLSYARCGRLYQFWGLAAGACGRACVFRGWLQTSTTKPHCPTYVWQHYKLNVCGCVSLACSFNVVAHCPTRMFAVFYPRNLFSGERICFAQMLRLPFWMAQRRPQQTLLEYNTGIANWIIWHFRIAMIACLRTWNSKMCDAWQIMAPELTKYLNASKKVMATPRIVYVSMALDAGNLGTRVSNYA